MGSHNYIHKNITRHILSLAVSCLVKFSMSQNTDYIDFSSCRKTNFQKLSMDFLNDTSVSFFVFLQQIP